MSTTARSTLPSSYSHPSLTNKRTAAPAHFCAMIKSESSTLSVALARSNGINTTREASLQYICANWNHLESGLLVL